MKFAAASLSAMTILAIASASPAAAVCFARDDTKPGGWDLDRSVGARTFPVDDEFRRSGFVGVVKVTSVRALNEDRNDPEGISAHVYRVELMRTFKGQTAREFELYSESSSGRFDMTVGSAYLVFVQNAGGNLAVNNCGWSDELTLTGTTLKRVELLAEGRVP